MNKNEKSRCNLSRNPMSQNKRSVSISVCRTVKNQTAVHHVVLKQEEEVSIKFAM